MEPVLALSPSASYHESPNHSNASLQTTPQLPKRERLASFSRLLTSENFDGINISKPNPGRKRGSLKARRIGVEDLPTIRVSPTSPQICTPSVEKNQKHNLNGLLGSNSLPFSPRLLNQKSPCYMSPSYRRPTPTKSPLYIGNTKSLFLGRGSFGNVTLCQYKDQKFAVKVISKNDSVGERNFIGIGHPHLVKILHVYQMSNKVFVCMEFAGHCNLQQVLDTKCELDFPRKLSFCTQIASGIRHCHHHQLVHGDLKPSNVIVSPYGVCKLCDFGHSVRIGTENKSQTTGTVPGTVAYAAPEVLKGSQPTLASDMYSFGILLWQVHSMEMPYAGQHPHAVIYKVAHYGVKLSFKNCESDALKQYSDIAMNCWCSYPEDRYNASEALQMLQVLAKDRKEYKS